MSDNEQQNIDVIGAIGSAFKLLGNKLIVTLFVLLALFALIVVVLIVLEKPITISSHLTSTHNSDVTDDEITFQIN